MILRNMCLYFTSPLVGEGGAKRRVRGFLSSAVKNTPLSLASARQLPHKWGALSICLFILCIFIFPAHAQQSGDPQFQAFVQQKIWPKAQAAGIDQATFAAAFEDVTSPDRSILGTAKKQPEFASTVGNYVGKRVSPARIQNGAKKLEDGRIHNALSQIGKKYNVDPFVVLSIWGIESSYGAALNPETLKNVFRSMATLAYADSARREFGFEQTIAALKIVKRGYAEVHEMRGSWAGAMGHTQFIPTSYLVYAQDFDGDGHRDIWNNIGDALASTAAHLATSEGNAPTWIDEEPWGVEVVVPQGFNYANAYENGGFEEKSITAWQQLGIRAASGGLPNSRGEATLYVPSGVNGPAFLLYPNFKVIKRYNFSNAYALAVGLLADRLRGENVPVRSWPSDDDQLTRIADVKLLQSRLTQLGHYNGKIDGFVGPKVYAATHAFQARAGISPADGLPTQEVLEALRDK